MDSSFRTRLDTEKDAHVAQVQGGWLEHGHTRVLPNPAGLDQDQEGH
jgi:hypothetical protein